LRGAKGGEFAPFRDQLSQGGRVKPFVLLFSLVLFPFSISYLLGEFRRFRTRLGKTSDEQTMRVARVERWKYIGIAIGLVSVLPLGYATITDAPERVIMSILCVPAIGLAITLIASVVSGWMKGGGQQE
jgi:hypothetical protein